MVAPYVAEKRSREERIERVVAIVSTVLVLLVFSLSAGVGLIEGVLAYAVVGGVVWLLAKKTFRRRSANR